jgi:anti-repressor protein
MKTQQDLFSPVQVEEIKTTNKESSSELIKITKSEGGKDVVSAKNLYEFLEIETRFDVWIKRMLEYGFTEKVDYQCLIRNDQMPNGGTRSVIEDYAITLDCAKSISMLQRNDKGMQARNYFIACEKKLREITQPQLPQDYLGALKQLVEQVELNQQQQKQLIEQQPKVNYATAVEISPDSVLVGELAKQLHQKGVDTGEKRLFEWLRNNGYLCKQGEKYNQPTQRAMNMGLFEIQKRIITRPGQEDRIEPTTRITGKGQIYFVNKFLPSSKPHLKALQ